ncbi:hypothetical protein M8C21_004909, partial [Ambrosia artemisiifolia]
QPYLLIIAFFSILLHRRLQSLHLHIPSNSTLALSGFAPLEKQHANNYVHGVICQLEHSYQDEYHVTQCRSDMPLVLDRAREIYDSELEKKTKYDGDVKKPFNFRVEDGGFNLNESQMCVDKIACERPGFPKDVKFEFLSKFGGMGRMKRLYEMLKSVNARSWESDAIVSIRRKSTNVKLSDRAPSPDVKLNLLMEIAEEYELDWDPTASETKLLKPHEDL